MSPPRLARVGFGLGLLAAAPASSEVIDKVLLPWSGLVWISWAVALVLVSALAWRSHSRIRMLAAFVVALCWAALRCYADDLVFGFDDIGDSLRREVTGVDAAIWIAVLCLQTMLPALAAVLLLLDPKRRRRGRGNVAVHP